MGEIGLVWGDGGFGAVGAGRGCFGLDWPLESKMILDVSENIVQVICTANRGKEYAVEFDRRTNTVVNVYSIVSRLGYNPYWRLLYNYVHKNKHYLTAWCAINAARAKLKKEGCEDYRRIGAAYGYGYEAKETKMQTTRATTGGLEPRFVIERADGKPISPTRRYSLILDFSGADPHALVAAKAYADSIRPTNPQLADDIEAAIANPSNAPAQHKYAV